MTEEALQHMMCTQTNTFNFRALINDCRCTLRSVKQRRLINSSFSGAHRQFYYKPDVNKYIYFLNDSAITLKEVSLQLKEVYRVRDVK